MIWQLFLETWRFDPWWMTGSLLLFLTAFSFFLYSFFRHIRTLGWFYVAAVLGGAIFMSFFFLLPEVLEYLAAYRADWSLLYLLQTSTVRSLLTEFVLYCLLYSVFGIFLLVGLEAWALLSFSWKRMKVIYLRAVHQSWFILFFSLLTIVLSRLGGSLFTEVSWVSSLNVLFLLFFFFYLQFFLRLLDSARFHVSHLFLEFVYALGFVVLILSFSFDWYAFLVYQEGSVYQLFLSHLFLFFLSVLLLGMFATFVIRSFFISPFFLHHLAKKTTFLSVLMNNSARELFYTRGYVFLGVLCSVVMGFLFITIYEWELYLFQVLLFFAGFFILFYLLDRQEDMRIRGDLVDQRIQSGTHKSFQI